MEIMHMKIAYRYIPPNRYSKTRQTATIAPRDAFSREPTEFRLFNQQHNARVHSNTSYYSRRRGFSRARDIYISIWKEPALRDV